MANAYANLARATSALDYTQRNRNTVDIIENILGGQIGVGRAIVFTGIGKNGYVAKLIASTYSSLGIKARYIDPVDILHGEMRTLNSEDDFIVYISKSGKTAELCVLANHLHQRGFDSLLITSAHPISDTYIQASDKISLNYLSEMDDDDIVPTASLLVYLAILQAVGVSIAEDAGFHSKKLFKERHPGGTIGAQD